METRAPEYASGLGSRRSVAPSEALYKALAIEMARPTQEPRQGIRGQIVMEPMSSRPLSLLVIVFSLMAFASLIVQWHNNSLTNWIFFWMVSGFSLLIALVYFWGELSINRSQARESGQTDFSANLSMKALRTAVLTGNDELAPLFASETMHIEQPASATDEPVSINVLPPHRRFYWLSHVFLAIYAGMIVSLFVMQLQTSSDRYPVPWQIFVLFVIVAIEYIWMSIVLTRRLRPIHVKVQADDGLHWRAATRQWQALPWSEVRGWSVFFMDTARAAPLPPSAIYTVTGQHASLSWLSQASKDSSIQTSQSLVRHIQTHLNLPLRDLTPGLTRISHEVVHTLGRMTVASIATNTRTLWGLPIPSPTSVRVGLALSVLAIVAGILTPFAQQWYFGGQLIQLETAKSAIHDPLTSNALQWTPGAASSGLDYPIPNNTPPAFSFTPFGYVYVSSVCCDVSSRTAQPISNGLVEVTARQRSQFDLATVGILFRANLNDHSALVFTISANGGWRLSQFALGANGVLTNEHNLRYEGTFGGFRVIHQGSDATNRIAVLMQGPSYTFFVNGQFVGGYTAGDLPLSGQVGVYADGSGDAVTFSDLLIAHA